MRRLRDCLTEKSDRLTFFFLTSLLDRIDWQADQQNKTLATCFGKLPPDLFHPKSLCNSLQIAHQTPPWNTKQTPCRTQSAMGSLPFQEVKEQECVLDFLIETLYHIDERITQVIQLNHENPQIPQD